MNESKFCVDCKHCKKGSMGYQCAHPEVSVKRDLVTGERHLVNCNWARQKDCLPEAKFFEPLPVNSRGDLE